MKSLSELRSDARSIFQAGLKAADPADAIRRHLKLRDEILEIDGRTYDLSSYDGLYVVGAGKAAAKMAQAIEAILIDRLKGGFVNVEYNHAIPLNIVKINEAGHPLPDEAGMRGAEEIVGLLRQT